MKYTIHGLQSPFVASGEGWNISWLLGRGPYDVAMLTVSDDKTIEHYALGEGFEVKVDIVKPGKVE